MSALAKIDSKVVADAEEVDPVEAEQQAMEAAVAAGLKFDEIESVKATVKVGRFVATQMSGYVIGTTRISQAALLEVLRVQADMVSDYANGGKRKLTPLELATTADSMAKVSNALSQSNQILLKAAEVAGQGKRKVNRQSNAPQFITGTVINAENVQVNGEPSGVAPA